MSTVKSTPPEIPGLTFEDPLGSGGFADVFVYKQHSTNRRIAVKVLRPEHMGTESLAQFQHEADVMARVSTHPYIVTALDAGVATDGRPYLAMEFYPLPHFGLRARRGELGIAEILRVGIQVASAVEATHRAGILHRDIKPANILTSEYGNPGLADFGVAGAVGEGLGVTGGVSPGFTAPEVLLDDYATGSRQSDVYALGATLYALVEGRAPVWRPGGDNSEAALTRRAASGDITPIRRDDAPRMIEHAIRQCLDPVPAKRPESAADFARMLQDIEQSLALTPTPLALAGVADPAARPTTTRRSTDPDDDATARKPRVVDPQGTPAPAAAPRGPSYAAAPTASPSSAPVATPPAADLGSLPAPGGFDTGGIDTAHTISRPTGDRSVDPHGDDAGSSARPRWLLPLLIGGTAAILIAIVAVITGTGTGKDRSPATTTTWARSKANDPFVASMVGTPAGGKAVRGADGGVTLTWEPPHEPSSTAREAFRFDILLAGTDTVLGNGVAGYKAEIPAAKTGTGEFCVDLYGLVGDTASVEPLRLCTDEAKGDGGP